MVKKSLLVQKLASYFTLATVVLASEKDADAQIVYSKIDTNFCTDMRYNLDLNNDGIIDFIINDFHREYINSGSGEASTVGIRIYNENSNAVANFQNVAALFNSGQEIGAKDNFYTGRGINLVNREVYFNQQFYRLNLYTGLWKATDQEIFLDLQLKVDSNTYYGWARLSVNSENIGYCVGLQDYALNTRSGESILAGEEVSPPSNNGSLMLFPDPASNKSELNISFKLSSPQTTSIAIYDITGKKMNSITFQNTYTGLNTFQINIAHLAEEIYILKLTTNESESTEKFIVAQ